jgi:hypothetical protein
VAWRDLGHRPEIELPQVIIGGCPLVDAHRRVVVDTTQLLQRLIFTTMAMWFVIDSVGSLAAGSWLNVVSNVAFLGAFVLPARRL